MICDKGSRGQGFKCKNKNSEETVAKKGWGEGIPI